MREWIRWRSSRRIDRRLRGSPIQPANPSRLGEGSHSLDSMHLALQDYPPINPSHVPQTPDILLIHHDFPSDSLIHRNLPRDRSRVFREILADVDEGGEGIVVGEDEGGTLEADVWTGDDVLSLG